MKADSNALKLTAANFAFSAFLFLVFGWALMEAQLFHIAAGFRAHLVLAATCSGASVVALRRCRLWWSLFADMDTGVNRTAANRYRVGDVASSLALLAAGCVLALSAKSDLITLFAICAGAFSLAPWSRFAFCRRHFFASCLMLGAGAAPIFIVTRGTTGPFDYLLWTWFLWMYAAVALLATLTSGRPAIPRTKAGLAVEVQNPPRVVG